MPAFKDLHEFIAFLEKKGQLRRISARVSQELEISEITDRVCKGPAEKNVALLFERVEGAAFPVLMNMFGTEQRVCWALGVERLDELGERVAKLLAMDVPHSLLDKLKKLVEVSEVARFGPKVVDSGPCQEVVEPEPSLASL